MAPTSARKKGGGADTGPSPLDRRKTGSKHHLICDGHGTPLKVITTEANVNDVTQTPAPIDGIPPVAGRPGRPRRRPNSLLGDNGYDSNPNRRAPLRRRADLRPAPPLQTTRRPLETPHRTPRRSRLPRLQPHLLATPQASPTMIDSRDGPIPSITSKVGRWHTAPAHLRPTRPSRAGYGPTKARPVASTSADAWLRPFRLQGLVAGQAAVEGAAK
ncbi:transposase [Streptomyces sp. NPDC048270]|uniref:transposase n=1 Tax=Streptomyces sp. NPDC048270 TaxID=3154615 RepID=UPI0033E8F78F